MRDATAGGPGIIPRGFLVTNKKKAADGKLVEIDAGYSNRPWYDRPGVDRENLDKLASYWADRAGGSGEGERALAEAAAAKATTDSQRSAEEVSAFANEGNPNLLYQSDKPDTWYYSALARGVDTAQMKAAPAQGWKDWLKGQTSKGAIKSDEIKWSGLEEWLDIQQGRVTKEQIADYLKSGGVRVEEKILGRQGISTAEMEQDRRQTYGEMSDQELYNEWNADYENFENRPYQGQISRQVMIDDLVESARDYFEMNPADLGDGVKFGQYVLPGAKGGSYRELLLTLPRTPYDRAAATAETNRIAGEYEARINNVVEAGNIGEYEGGRGAALREADRLRAEREAVLAPLRAQQPADSNFQSTHFDQPNILAHIRFNERTDADGKRVLFVEEIQSDWAQKGREQGFKEDEVGMAEFVGKDADGWGVRYPGGRLLHYATQEEAQRNVDRINNSGGAVVTGIPSAPFVEKTQAWTALAVKRMIRYAAENGFDKIAWTRGEQQVDRYTSALRKAVDVVEWKKTEEGIQLVGYKGKEGKGLSTPEAAGLEYLERIAHERVLLPHERERLNDLQNRLADRTSTRTKVVDTTEKESALSDAIGKSMAEKIIQDPNQSGTIEGKDIKIDDTGMAGFYDRMLPSITKEVLKKLGGGKVGEAELGGKKDPTDGWKLVENEAGNFEIIDPEGNLADIADSRRAGEVASSTSRLGMTLGLGRFGRQDLR
jgi:hypothetical protein